jgi:hypothetical protein
MKPAMPDDAGSADRRRAPREIACFPAYVEREAPHVAGEREVGLIADIATSGALLLVRGPGFRPGEVVRLELLIGLETQGVRHATGRVLRIGPLPVERVSLWTHQVAVEFDSPISLDADEQRTLREQCARLGIRR